MRPFNLNSYLSNPSQKVMTADGHNARILCTDRKLPDYPVLALKEENGYEVVLHCTENGLTNPYSDYDKDRLFFAPANRVGWINLFYASDDTVNIQHATSSKVYPTEELAKEAVAINDFSYLTTVKIEWVE